MLYFFSGLGGAGTLPLAFILKGMGHDIAWSDRGRDQQQNPDKFNHLEAIWPQVYPQDGSGLLALKDKIAAVIPSGSVEADVPEMKAARDLGLPVIKRPELLSQLFNAAPTGISIAGTSGKTTTTGMTGFMLGQLGQDPTVMNGGVFRNFAAQNPWCCAMVGKGGIFVTESDESDGTISLYHPAIAVLTNISLDHKSMDELRGLFGAYLNGAKQAVVNADDAEVMALTHPADTITYGINNAKARLVAENIKLMPDGSTCTVADSKTGLKVPLRLNLLGKHNISNALAAMGVALALRQDMGKAAAALGRFTGIQRRLEIIGQNNGITVIDDFAHNPDKISASLSALRSFHGRLLVMFQPHGFGPIRTMRHELVDSFASHLIEGDKLYMPEPFYAGGTVDRSVTSQHLVDDLKARGVEAISGPSRDALLPALLAKAQPGDRIVVMGARDDTLADYARQLLEKLTAPAPAPARSGAAPAP